MSSSARHPAHLADSRSDPFFRLRAGDLRVDSDVVKASLNPIWGELPDGVYFHQKDGYARKPVQVELPVFGSHVDKQRIELVLCVATALWPNSLISYHSWDKDRLTKKFVRE
jgi:hypothetical protein